MDIPAVTREAFVLLANAAALRKVGRTADAVGYAARARQRLTEVVAGVDAMIAEMQADPIPLVLAPNRTGRRPDRGAQPACRRKRASAAVGFTPQAVAQAANSATSTRRLPTSQLCTQLCGLPSAWPSSRWVSFASSRSARRNAGRGA